jgi:hypothetical protein
MESESDVPSGLPEEEPEAPPLGVPAEAGEEDDSEVGRLPGIPEEGEPPTSG